MNKSQELINTVEESKSSTVYIDDLTNGNIMEIGVALRAMEEGVSGLAKPIGSHDMSRTFLSNAKQLHKQLQEMLKTVSAMEAEVESYEG